MSQIQNCTLRHLVEPIAFMTVAFLGGRRIHYFPGTSQAGLFMTAALGSGSAFASHLLKEDNEQPLYSIMRNTALLALTAIGAPLLGKALQGRATVSFSGAFRLTVIEATLAAISTLMTPEIELEARHKAYEDNPKSWTDLSPDKKVDLIRQFFEKGLAPLPLQKGEIGNNPLKLPENFSDLSPNQLQWHAQMHLHISPYKPELLFSLTKACHEKDIPIAWDKHSFDLLHTYFTMNPQTRLDELPELPTFIQGLTSDQILAFSQNQIASLDDYMKEKITPLLRFRDLSAEQQMALNIRFSQEEKDCRLLWSISNESIDIAKQHNDFLEHLHHQLYNQPIAFAILDDSLKERLSSIFAQNSLSAIPEVQPQLGTSKKNRLPMQWNNQILEMWNIYYQSHPDIWKNLSEELRTQFVNAFIYHNQATLPIKGLKLAVRILTLLKPTLTTVGDISKNRILWFLKLDKHHQILNQDTNVRNKLLERKEALAN